MLDWAVFCASQATIFKLTPLNAWPKEDGKKRSWLLIHRLSGTCSEAQGALLSLGECSHQHRNPSFHLGHPTERKNEDDNRGINNLLQLPNSVLQFQRPASWSQIPESHFLAKENCTTRQCCPLPAASPAILCPSDPVRTAQKYLLINHTAHWARQADKLPGGSRGGESIQWWRRSITGQGLFPMYWTYLMFSP